MSAADTRDTARIQDLIAAQAAGRPDAPAIVDPLRGARGYAEYHAAIGEAAAFLRDHGVQPGDRVLVVAENCLATAVFLFAIVTVGAYAVPVNARMTAPEIARVAAHATPRVTLYTTEASPEAARHAAAAGATAHRAGHGDFALSAADVAPAAQMAGDETAIILYTTGTTGDPKGVMLTHANLLFAGAASARLRHIAADDRMYGALPLTHVFGVASMLMACSHAGAAIRLETRFRPDLLHAALLDDVTIFPAVPQMHALLMQYTKERGIGRLEGTRLRYVSSGAAPLDPAWKRKAEAFYGLALQNGYGMTESTAGVCATSNPIGTPDTSVGPPLPGIEVALDASVGNEGGVGEILTRGPHVMKGYYADPDATARAIDGDGWLRTGDLGRIDGDGNLHVVGRCKELIIRGGFNVYPPEVEAALNNHPDVIQSAVIGRRLEGGDEEILAFVQCADPGALDVAALGAFAAERLARYKRPSRILPVAGLPAAATGKLLKHRLLSTFADMLAPPPAPGG